MCGIKKHRVSCSPCALPKQSCLQTRQKQAEDDGDIGSGLTALSSLRHICGCFGCGKRRREQNIRLDVLHPKGWELRVRCRTQIWDTLPCGRPAKPVSVLSRKRRHLSRQRELRRIPRLETRAKESTATASVRTILSSTSSLRGMKVTSLRATTVSPQGTAVKRGQIDRWPTESCRGRTRKVVIYTVPRRSH